MTDTCAVDGSGHDLRARLEEFVDMLTRQLREPDSAADMIGAGIWAANRDTIRDLRAILGETAIDGDE